ncbi:MAG: GxxExxY protein [Balneolaceae bacterium]|nr:GxxExxY protein [Balneolaceae bacterium]
MKNQYKYSDLTGSIIKAAMTVHSTLGNGFQEVIYQRALQIELKDVGLSFVREQEMPVYYKNIPIGKRRVDFFGEDKIALEIKAVLELQDVHIAQAINYLEAFDLEVGLLINFGSRSLQFKRVYNKSFKQKAQGNPLTKRTSN